MTFKNPVGLAAGFDKNAEYIDLMAKLGFGFIEVGTLTPLPQPGNAKPRSFKLTNEEIYCCVRSTNAEHQTSVLAPMHFQYFGQRAPASKDCRYAARVVPMALLL